MTIRRGFLHVSGVAKATDDMGFSELKPFAEQIKTLFIVQTSDAPTESLKQTPLNLNAPQIDTPNFIYTYIHIYIFIYIHEIHRITKAICIN